MLLAGTVFYNAKDAGLTETDELHEAHICFSQPSYGFKRDFLKHKTIKVRDNKLNRRFGVDITPLSR